MFKIKHFFFVKRMSELKHFFDIFPDRFMPHTEIQSFFQFYVMTTLSMHDLIATIRDP